MTGWASDRRRRERAERERKRREVNVQRITVLGQPQVGQMHVDNGEGWVHFERPTLVSESGGDE